MKNICNKLKKTISFYILILSILFFLVALVFKCIYVYNYTRVSEGIKDCMQNGQRYVVHTYFGDDYGESFSADNFANNITYLDYYTKTMLNMQKKDYIKYYNDIPIKIIIVSILCFCVFGYLCYIKLHPEKKIKINQNNSNRVNTNNTLSYSSNKPIVECPYCHSKDTKKISGLSKVGSVALFGVFALGKTSKQFHCKQCGADF